MEGQICITFLAACLLVLGCIAAPPQDFGSPDYPSLGDGRHPSKRDNSFIGNHGASDSFQNNGRTGKAQRSGKGHEVKPVPFHQAQVKSRFNGRIVGNNALNGQDNYNGYAAVYNSHSFDGNIAGDGSFNNNGNGLEPPVISDPLGASGNHESFDGNTVGRHGFNDNGNGLEPPVIFDPLGASGNHESFDGNTVGRHGFNDNGNGLEPPVIFDPLGASGNHESFDGNTVGRHSFNDNGNGLEPPVIFDPLGASGNHESFDGNTVGRHGFNDNGDS
ncbi:N66 matrix protein-like isoform X2 [Dromaius novaehollandiae]|uniref:N66 matrix protein-like isoform X2 n=1 Tax=Dromaius novaehollandiae TaxID=8790 RepID=UPI00311F6F29